jgi:hypothetical protein
MGLRLSLIEGHKAYRLNEFLLALVNLLDPLATGIKQLV